MANKKFVDLDKDDYLIKFLSKMDKKYNPAKYDELATDTFIRVESQDSKL